MLVTDLLSADRIRVGARAGSKKRLLEMVSDLIASDPDGNDDELSPREVFESLCARERLSSTGLGSGVAIPHGRVTGGRQVRAAFLKLRTPIDYNAMDEQPVDLLFALTVPEDSTEEHLKLLAQVATLFSDADFCRQLRDADSATELKELLTSWRPH